MKPGFAGADLATPLAADAGALSALKQQAKSSPKAALSAAATQFEAMFVQMLLKSMREALPQDGMLSSEQSKLYTSLFDQQIAQQMSKRGIGLKQVLERQLAPSFGADDPKAAAGAASKIATGASDVGAAVDAARNAAARASRNDAPLGAAGTLRRTMTTPAAPAKTDATSDGSAASRVPANVRAFVEAMRPHAEAAARVVGVPADLLLAQAGLETGWGRSQPKAADGAASHNLFGIKAGRSWDGKVAVASTTEYVAGAFVRTIDKFRAYGSYTEAFQDFGRLITGSARYAKAAARTDDPIAYAKSLQQGGYATDPHYADKLVRAIRLVAGHPATDAPAQVLAGGAVNPTSATADATRRTA
jgi:flagellar protein FlgJ